MVGECENIVAVLIPTIVRQVSDAVCPWWGGMVSKGENNTAEGTLLEVRL